MTSLLVTNDFPPKHGGIQSYLYEFWRRLPPGETTVLTTPFAGAASGTRDAARSMSSAAAEGVAADAATAPHDRAARSRRRRRRDLPRPDVAARRVGPTLRNAPYVVVAHGAEITGYARIPRHATFCARKVLRGAAGVVAVGQLSDARVRRVPPDRPLPGVRRAARRRHERFHPLNDDERCDARRASASTPIGPLVLGSRASCPARVSTCVIDAVAGLAPQRAARDRRRRARSRTAPTSRTRPGDHRCEFLGRVDDCDLPALYGCADVFAMRCRADRWGGIEAEGFGIVFLEAAACGVPQSRAAAGARTRRSRDGRPASSSSRVIVAGGAPRAHPAARRRRPAPPDGRGGPQARRSSSSATTISSPARTDRCRQARLVHRPGPRGDAFVTPRWLAPWTRRGGDRRRVVGDVRARRHRRRAARTRRRRARDAGHRGVPRSRSSPASCCGSRLRSRRSCASARGDDIAVASWVFLSGSAPTRRVRNIFIGGGRVSARAVDRDHRREPVHLARADLLPLAYAAWWGARHGMFPARATRQPEVLRVTDQASERIRIDAPADRCFDVAVDFESYPEWARDVKEAKILERDDEHGRGAAGRVPRRRARQEHPLRARVRLRRCAAQRSRGTSSRATCCCAASTAPIASSPRADVATRVHYDLAVELAMPLPRAGEAPGRRR